MAAAAGLHGLITLWGSRAKAHSPEAARELSDQHLFIDLDAPAGPSQGLPGGGSAEPDRQGKLAAPEVIEPRARVAPPVVRAPRVARPVLREQVQPLAQEPEAAVSDLLAADNSDEAPVPRPRAARTNSLRERGPEAAASPDAITHVASTSASMGFGYGNHGGPGGLGAGPGGGGHSPFGGSSGAFVATVCFLDTQVNSLREVKSCPPQITFYTDALDVSPRHFTNGFPGVSNRNEWFAIRYRGKFQVREAETYTFRLLSDDGSWLDIDGYRVIDNDYRHAPRSMEGTVTLDAGPHEFSVFYYQGYPDMIALQLFVRAVGRSEKLFGPTI